MALFDQYLNLIIHWDLNRYLFNYSVIKTVCTVHIVVPTNMFYVKIKFICLNLLYLFLHFNEGKQKSEDSKRRTSGSYIKPLRK